MSAEETHRSRLGRGLASLIGDAATEPAAADRGRGHRRVQIAFLRPNPRNPRKVFSDAEIIELANSIRERGIIQPIVVRTVRGASEQFEIIAGERRWRAAQRAGLHEVPIILHEATDAEALELAIIENVQRADLNPLEEAAGYQALADEYKYTQEDIAKTVQDAKQGRVEFRLDRLANIHVPLGKVSFEEEKIRANMATLIEAVNAAKPRETKGDVTDKIMRTLRGGTPW